MNYIECINTILKANREDHDISSIESHLIEVVKECAAGTDDSSISNATGVATSKFETAINNIWKLLYLIPMITLEDKPEKWEIVEQSPMLGRDFRTSSKTVVHVNMLERHTDTIDGTPGCVYRINANSKLAFMLYGNNIIEYNTNNGKDMNLHNTYSCACFIDQFPFTVPYPTVTTIIHVKSENSDETEDYGFISDIRNISREEISAEDVHNRFFSPNGTSLYPNLTDEERNEMNDAANKINTSEDDHEQPSNENNDVNTESVPSEQENHP